MWIYYFFVNAESVNLAILFGFIEQSGSILELFEHILASKPLHERIVLMNLQKQALKYIVGVLILAAVVHIDEAGVKSILVYLRASLDLSLLR